MVAEADPDFRHATPPELQDRLDAMPELAEKWASLTDLARNEFICWMTSPKKAETRATRFERLQQEVLSGKRRPCCWPWCPHRRASARKWIDA